MPVPLGGEYEFLGIPPGHVEVSASGFRGMSTLTEGHTLPAVPEQRIDLRLFPLWNVAVYMRTPDGAPFRTAFRRGFWPSDKAFPRIVLTGAPSTSPDLRDADQLPASAWSYVDDVAFEDEDDARTGSLVGSAELPAWASACLGDWILDTRLLPPASTSLELVLDPAVAEASRGSVTFRVLDSRTGLPILDTYGFAISEAAEGDGRDALLKLWPEGVSRAKDLPPGRHTLVVQIPGYEYVRRMFTLHPGAVMDLGDLVVGPARAIQGHVRDESGQPITSTPTVRRAAAPFERLGLGDSQEEGWFLVTALPDDTTVTLSIEHEGWALTPRRVRLAGEDLTDFDLVVRRGLPVVIEREGEEPRGLRLLSSEGLFVWGGDGALREYRIRLMPGTYEATSGFETPSPKSFALTVSADSRRFLY